MRFRPNIKRDKIFINVRAHAISIILNTFTVLTFDTEGRLIWAYLDGCSFRRSFDNKVIERYRENKVAVLDYEKMEMEKRRFLSIYKPISILPPDQYLALVLQVTEGCWWNKCTFCDLYRDRKFAIKSDEEVLRHIKEIRGFLGEI